MVREAPPQQPEGGRGMRALDTGIPHSGRTTQLPSWNILADFITHCRNVMTADDIKRELAGKPMQALQGEKFAQPPLSKNLPGYASSEQIIAALEVPNERKAA